MSNRREMSKWKRCKICGATMRLANIRGIICYVHRNHVERKICHIRKAKAAEAEKQAQNASG